MGVMRRGASGVIDLVVTPPISYAVKGFTGKSIGDHISGEKYPPSTNGAVGGVVSYVVDTAGFYVSLPTRVITGNSLGDYITGDTIAKRKDAESAELAQEKADVRVRQDAREQQQMTAMEQELVQAPTLGQAQERGQSPSL